MKIIKFIFFSLLFLLISLISYVYIGSSGLIGDLPKDGNIVPKVEIKTEQNQKGIFFGDLHVHTTFSQDAFLFSLPMLQGEGVHPPSDACNFARYCSSLDFFSITDHAEAITKDMWDSTINSLRSCEISDKNGNKDLLAFPGWEWTQMGQSPDNHYGHKNVILRDLDKVPERPIGAGTTGIDSMIDNPIMPLLPLVLDFPPERIDFDFLAYAKEVYGSPICSEEITEDCRESALTPKELFKKLNNLKVESLVIPHGTTWGIHSPPESSFKTQLENGNHDPLKQRLIEVYSGHGNSELYKDIKKVHLKENDGLENETRMKQFMTEKPHWATFLGNGTFKEMNQHQLANMFGSDGSFEYYAKESLNVKFDHELDISFNSRYLIDIASQLDGNKIEIFLNDTGSPALIKDPSDFDSIYVVMPMNG